MSVVSGINKQSVNINDTDGKTVMFYTIDRLD